ncbi:MAG: DUF4936 family protein [Zoogloea sp.]|uniref:DUF4936 family protein n=1 Tax=Zoogloea sp. TaxID=49181 RepID=UPI002638F407|nr:DUF4936 family protein [Zoogloea sp.]MDD2991301.1 DUF4936 family protein [Zoogloea sp.]
MPSSHYFIYYPVRIGMEADLARGLYNLQAEIQASTGVAGRFLRKADDPWTWMEIYENVLDAPAFDAVLERAIERHGLMRFIEDGGRRHTERFVPCA